MTSEIAFVVFMVIKAPSVCLASLNIFVDACAPTTQVQQPWSPFYFGGF